MPGDPWPSEFYARYPQAFRVPVRMVWREGTSRSGAPRPPREKTAAVRPVGGDQALAEETPEAEAALGGAVAVVPAVGSPHGGGDPVGAFLRMNAALDRLAGKAAPNFLGIPIAAGPNWNQISQQMGIDPFDFYYALHGYKEYNRLRPSDNISINPRTGQGTVTAQPTPSAACPCSVSRIAR
jgi:hypothetical protein